MEVDKNSETKLRQKSTIERALPPAGVMTLERELKRLEKLSKMPSFSISDGLTSEAVAKQFMPPLHRSLAFDFGSQLVNAAKVSSPAYQAMEQLRLAFETNSCHSIAKSMMESSSVYKALDGIESSQRQLSAIAEMASINEKSFLKMFRRPQDEMLDALKASVERTQKTIDIGKQLAGASGLGQALTRIESMHKSLVVPDLWKRNAFFPFDLNTVDLGFPKTPFDRFQMITGLDEFLKSTPFSNPFGERAYRRTDDFQTREISNETVLAPSEVQHFCSLHSFIELGIADLGKYLSETEKIIYKNSGGASDSAKKMILYVRHRFDRCRQIHAKLNEESIYPLRKPTPMAAVLLDRLWNLPVELRQLAIILDKLILELTA